MCCSLWDCKESEKAERLNNSNVENTYDLLSQQISHIEYSIINYSPHAVH